jgi:hypothetical protein
VMPADPVEGDPQRPNVSPESVVALVA